MRFVVTGGAGFIGNNIVKLLLEQKNRGWGKRNNNQVLKMLSPQLCQLLYIFIVNWIQM